MTRPSPLPSVPLRSPRPAGMSSCTRWRTTPRSGYHGRATIVGRSTTSGRPQRPSTERGVASVSACRSARRALPCLPRLVPCRAGHVRRGPGPGEEGLQIAKAVAHPGSLMHGLVWDWPAVPSAKATCPGHSPCLNGPWASVTRRTFQPISLDGCGLGCGVHRWPGASPRPCRCSRRRWNRPLQRK